jgi:hypothetical protein
MRPQQQTFVKNAVWDPGTQRGSGDLQAAFIVAGVSMLFTVLATKGLVLFYVKAKEKINTDT